MTSPGPHGVVPIAVSRADRDMWSKSGRDYDKISIFETFYGKLETATIIKECAINIECIVSEVHDYNPNEGIIGEAIQSYANPDCLVEGKLDMKKVKPFVWATGGDFGYYALGKRLSDWIYLFLPTVQIE